MQTCDTCGNEYDKCMAISYANETHHFDSFECAITALAPVCAQCGIKIIGHGVEQAGSIYCCSHCASAAGAKGVADRA